MNKDTVEGEAGCAGGPVFLREQPLAVTLVFLPGESQGQRSLVGCRLWGCTELDMTEATLQQQQQESNQGLLHCRWMLYQLPYQGRIYN